MTRQWQAYDVTNTEANEATGEEWRELVLHRHEYHDITLSQNMRTGRWFGVLRVRSVSGDDLPAGMGLDVADFSKPQELPEKLAAKLAAIATKEAEK
jgi:hypothetical protein